MFLHGYFSVAFTKISSIGGGLACNVCNVWNRHEILVFIACSWFFIISDKKGIKKELIGYIFFTTGGVKDSPEPVDICCPLWIPDNLKTEPL